MTAKMTDEQRRTLVSIWKNAMDLFIERATIEFELPEEASIDQPDNDHGFASMFGSVQKWIEKYLDEADQQPELRLCVKCGYTWTPMHDERFCGNCGHEHGSVELPDWLNKTGQDIVLVWNFDGKDEGITDKFVVISRAADRNACVAQALYRITESWRNGRISMETYVFSAAVIADELSGVLLNDGAMSFGI